LPGTTDATAAERLLAVLLLGGGGGGGGGGTFRQHTRRSSRALGAMAICGVWPAARRGREPRSDGDFVRFRIKRRQSYKIARTRVLHDNKSIPQVRSTRYKSRITLTTTTTKFAAPIRHLRRKPHLSRQGFLPRSGQFASSRDSQKGSTWSCAQRWLDCISIHHTSMKKSPGANLTKQDALERGEKLFARREHKSGISRVECLG